MSKIDQKLTTGGTTIRLDQDPAHVKTLSLEQHIEGALKIVEEELRTGHEPEIFPLADNGISIKVPNLRKPKLQSDNKETAGYYYLGSYMIFKYDAVRDELVYKGYNSGQGRDFNYTFKLSNLPNLEQEVLKILDLDTKAKTFSIEEARDQAEVLSKVTKNQTKLKKAS